MTTDQLQYAVVRLATLGKPGEAGRLLFASVSELPKDRSPPSPMNGADKFRIRGTEETLYFRRTILTTESAQAWYRSLAQPNPLTPVPAREPDVKFDGIPIRVPRLTDAQSWPTLGLPINHTPMSGSIPRAADPAPFRGSTPSRIHRQFGDRDHLEAFLGSDDAQRFLARRVHVNLQEYQEYLGSAVYIAPDHLIQRMEVILLPADAGARERILYRFIPRSGRIPTDLTITAFDNEARLLTRFETHEVPEDGILVLDKETCTGEYGFVVTHASLGVLAYQPPAPFVRKITTTLRASSGARTLIRANSSSSANSQKMEYQAGASPDFVSIKSFGDDLSDSPAARVNAESARRNRLSMARDLGQQWFPQNSRMEVASFIRELIRPAQTRVIIADPYLGADQLGQFLYVLHGESIGITLITTSLAFGSDESPKIESVRKFDSEVKKLSRMQSVAPITKIVSASSLHDRFLVIDEDVWFLGNSLNSIGDKACMIVRLPNPDEVIGELTSLIEVAQSTESYYKSLTKNSASQDSI